MSNPEFWLAAAVISWLVLLNLSHPLRRLMFKRATKKPFGLHYAVELIAWLAVLILMAIAAAESRRVYVHGFIIILLFAIALQAFIFWTLHAFLLSLYLLLIIVLLTIFTATLSKATSAILLAICLPWLLFRCFYQFHFWKINFEARIDPCPLGFFSEGLLFFE